MCNFKSGYLSSGKFRQFTAAIIVNIAALSYGTMCGWPSPVARQLRSREPPVGAEPLTEEQISWASAMICLGGLLTAPFSGWLCERLGRKRFGLAAGLALLASWLLVCLGTAHLHWLYAARFVGGMAASTVMFIVPLYVSEIASEEVRGALGSLLLFAINLGILLAFVAGALLSYRAFAVVCLMPPLLFLAALVFLPETPVYLVRSQRLSQARKCLLLFAGGDQLLADRRLARLQLQVSSCNASVSSPLRQLVRDRATRKALIISFGLLAGQQLSGIFAMISYAETIFKLSGSSLSPDAAAIVIGVIQVFGSYLSTMLMERAGRRPLALLSTSGMAVCHLTVGLFCWLQERHYDLSSVSWLPIVALSSYMIAYCLGMGPVPFVVTSEVFRLDVASLASSLCYVFLWLMAFSVMKLFGLAVQLMGVGGCFFTLAGFCAASSVFVYCLLPETKGRNREDIVDQLAGISKPVVTASSSHDNTRRTVGKLSSNNKDPIGTS